MTHTGKKFKHLIHLFVLAFCVAQITSCETREPANFRFIKQCATIFPDYTNVTIPANIAPLRFKLTEKAIKEAIAVVRFGEKSIVCKADDEGTFLFPEKKWHRLLQSAKGEKLNVTLYVNYGKDWLRYNDFFIFVSNDDIDTHLVYRLIQPGYVLWNKLGIYQRDLTNFKQKAIIENTQFDYNCINCHTFNQRNPKTMMLHMRAKWGGTYIFDDKRIEKINGNVNKRISSLVYPYWHPSGRYIAFSSNVTRQAFHLNDPNRIEVYDLQSDIVVYDTEKHFIVSDSVICSSKSFETFPAFSPDGKTLYFCTADAQPMPEKFKDVRYSLCAVSFDAKSQTIGHKIDTLFNSQKEKKSASFPRVSPDGRFLVFTVASYGNFSIWHKDADLYILDLKTRQYKTLAMANSNDVESYHSWSSNSRWLVFSSRRIDGLYTRPFITHISPKGQASKPFILPQNSPDFYSNCLFSFNIPEFVNGEVHIQVQDLIKTAHGDAIKIDY